jgi:hypothetical protein
MQCRDNIARSGLPDIVEGYGIIRPVPTPSLEHHAFSWISGTNQFHRRDEFKAEAERRFQRDDKAGNVALRSKSD